MFLKIYPIALIAILLFVVWGTITNCGKHVGIVLEQTVYVAKYIDSTYIINTEINIYNWIGACESEEYWEVQKVKCYQVDSTKKAEYNKAYPVYKSVKLFYNNNKFCKP